MSIHYSIVALLFAVSTLITPSTSASIIPIKGKPLISFSKAENLHSLFLSKTGYCDVNGLKNWTCPTCSLFPGVHDISVTRCEYGASQGFVAYDSLKDRIYYVFRGTVNPQGWIEDFIFVQTRYPNCQGCRVHEGLYNAYLCMATELLPALQALVHKHPTADIDIAGHSMGAAHSIFALMDVLRNIKGRTPYSTIRSYSFGMPRIVNDEFAAALLGLVQEDMNTVHFYNCNYLDPICLLAPRNLVKELFHYNYTQTPQEVFYPKGGHVSPVEYRLCKGTPSVQDPTCSSQVNFIDALIYGPMMYQHTTYLDMGLGCFISEDTGDDVLLSPAAKAEAVKERKRVRMMGMGVFDPKMGVLRRLGNMEKK